MKEDAPFPIKCEECEKNKFVLRLTEELNLKVICPHCGNSFELELANSTKKMRFDWEGNTEGQE